MLNSRVKRCSVQGRQTKLQWLALHLFKLVRTLNETSTSNLKMHSTEAEMIRTTKVIIWDKATMAPDITVTAINSILKETMINIHR